MSSHSLPILFSLVIPFLLLAHGAYGQGYIEINQAVIDDQGGFPYVIAQPGSYRLTGAVTKTAGDGTVPAIQITASNVTLDLAGFAISGPGVCSRNGTSGVVSCSGHVAGSGIQESGNANVVIRNGTVNGFFNGISTTAPYTVIELMTVYDSAFNGISAIGGGSTVRNSVAVRNGSSGVVIQNDSQINGCDASQNDDYGVSANQNSTVSNSTVNGNRLGGMTLNSSAVFTNNSVLDNFGPDPVFSGIDAGDNTCTNSSGAVIGC